MSQRSRKIILLSRRDEKKRVKKTIYLGIASLLLLAFLLFFGVPILGKFADFLDVVFGKKAADNSALQAGALPPPQLDLLPEATNSANLTVSGFAQNGEVEIFLNGEKTTLVKVDDGKFSYDDMKLKNGSNDVKARLLAEDKQSDFSDISKITLDTEEPSLEITSPTPDQNFSGVNRIQVSGNTEKDAQVYANGFLANVETDGKFEVFVPLKEGDNEIEVKAVDSAGNSTTQKVKVKYSK